MMSVGKMMMTMMIDPMMKEIGRIQSFLVIVSIVSLVALIKLKENVMGASVWEKLHSFWNDVIEGAIHEADRRPQEKCMGIRDRW